MDFLAAGAFTAKVYADGSMDEAHPNEVVVAEQPVKASESLDVSLAPGGGFDWKTGASLDGTATLANDLFDVGQNAPVIDLNVLANDVFSNDYTGAQANYVDQLRQRGRLDRHRR